MTTSSRLWRCLVRVAGGVHSIGDYDIVIHDHGAIFCSEMVVRWQWWTGESGRH